MPISSLNLQELATREDRGPGIKSWRIDGVDALGRPWGHGSFFGTRAEAEVVRDAVVFGLAELDKSELLDWVRARNTVASFDYANRDITEEDVEDHIFKWFMESPGAEAITVACWLNSINTGAFNSITTSMEIVEHRSHITSRFNCIVSVEPGNELPIRVQNG